MQTGGILSGKTERICNRFLQTRSHDPVINCIRTNDEVEVLEFLARTGYIFDEQKWHTSKTGYMRSNIQLKAYILSIDLQQLIRRNTLCPRKLVTRSSYGERHLNQIYKPYGNTSRYRGRFNQTNTRMNTHSDAH